MEHLCGRAARRDQSLSAPEAVRLLPQQHRAQRRRRDRHRRPGGVRAGPQGAGGSVDLAVRWRTARRDARGGDRPAGAEASAPALRRRHPAVRKGGVRSRAVRSGGDDGLRVGRRVHRVRPPPCRVRMPRGMPSRRRLRASPSRIRHDPQGCDMASAAPSPTRTETDSLGSMEIPVDAYWGIHTARADANFPITKRPISVYPDLVRALAMVKQASATANKEIGTLDAMRADLIDAAAQRVIDGEFHDQFTVGVIQGGAGTSTNMNANEVITNIALEAAGREKGDYEFLSPIDHTNRSQSTNDVYPTSIKIGLSLNLRSLLDELHLLRRAFLPKGADFGEVRKVARPPTQASVPM